MFLFSFTPVVNITPENMFIIISLIFISIMSLTSAIAILIIKKKKNILVKENDFLSDFFSKTDKFLKQRKSTLSISAFYVISIACMLIIAVILYILSGKMVVGAFGLIGLVVPYFIIDAMAQANTPKFEKNYSKSLSLLSSELRVNSSIPAAIENVAKSPFVEESMAKSYGQMLSGLALGRNIDDVFFEFAENNNSSDAYDVAAAVSIQSRVGGDIAKVLEDISNSINARMEERKKIKAMMTETTVMIWLFDIIPVAIILLMLVMMKDAYKVYFEEIKSSLVLGGIVISMVVGAVVSRVISKKAQNI